MDLQAQADAIRSAVGSVATCTPATSALLKGLLLPPKDDSATTDDNTSAPNSRPGSKATTRRPRTNTTVSRAPSRRARAAPTPTPTATESGLSTREKASLATHVVNATLKALGEAAKAVPPPAASRPTTEDDEGTGKSAGARAALRRSSSAPMSPLQPRSLNTRSPSRTASGAAMSNTTTTPPPSTNLLSAVECARVALAALRQLPASGKVTLPELQLESGMSALVGRLISLNLQDTAIKELRILKRRLDGLTCSSDAGKKGPKPEEPKNAAQLFSELLDFSSVQTSACQPPLLQLVVSTQLQILRVLALAKKPSATEAALPHLRLNQPSSPVSLLLAAATQDANADKSKLARQMETIAQCFLALTPSVARKDDSLGQETRLSVSPASALELQLLALETRLHCWALSGKHKGDAEKDILLPLSRCLAAYLRRTSESPRSSYAPCAEGFARVEKMLLSQKQGFQPAKGSKQPLAGIYQTLLALARDAGQIADALGWAEKLQDALDHGPTGESVAKMCAVAAQRLVLFLKQAGSASESGADSLSDTALGLLKQVVDGIQGPLRGDSGELDELLTQVCAVRKAGMQLLLAMAKEGGEVRGDTQNQLETFILQCPRFCLRWLGKPPDPKSQSKDGKDTTTTTTTTTTTKEILRYDQRRQLVRPYLPHLLDSAFLTIKTGLDQGRLQWELMDAVLGDCLTLLQYTSSASESATSAPASSYHVKISHFYYLQYTSLRQQPSTTDGDAKNSKRDALRALRHSIDAVRHRPRAERSKAQLTLKLERMAEMCRSLGRADEALAALQGIRRTLVEDGVLVSVARRLRSVSPAVIWAGGTTDTEVEVEALGRALGGIAKGQMAMPGGWVDWTGELDDEGEISSEEQRAAVWEHWVRFVLSLAGDGEEKGAGLEQDIGLDHPVVAALLAVYTPARYPIRRMRVLLMLLNAALGDITRAREVLGLLGDDALDISTPGKKPAKPLGQDTSLAPYLPHFQALSTALTSAVDAYHNSAALDQAVSIWKGLVASANHNKTALERLIDDIPGLLAYLESAADFLRVQGRHAARAGVLELVGDLTGMMGVVVQGRGEQEVQADLALQYTLLGQAERAEGVFRRVEEGLLVLGNGADKNAMSGEVRAGFHLAFAEHCILLGQARQAEEHLQRAQQAFVDDVGKSDAAERVPKHVRAERRRMVSHAGYLYSLLALERGDSHHALAYARDSVRGLFQAWTKLESGFTSKPKIIEEHSRPADDNQTIDFSSLQPATNNEPDSTPLLWRLFPPLYRAVLRLSALYAHLGMFQETMYYAEQARKMADAVRSDVYRAECAVWMAGLLWRAGEGERDRAGGLVREAVGLLGLSGGESGDGGGLGEDGGKGKGGYVTAALACRVGEMYLRQGDVEGARAVLERAEGMVEGLAGTQDEDEVQTKMAKLAISEQQQQQTKKPVKRKTVKTPARAGKTAVRKTAKATAKTATTTATAQAPAPVATPTQETTTQANTQLAQLRASILVQKAVSMLRQHDWAAAQDALTAAAAVSIGTTATATVSTSDVLPAVAMASCLLGMSMEQMAEDPVFSVIQDSTISFPAVGDVGESGLIGSPGTPGTVVRGRGGPGLGSAAGTRLVSGAKKPGLGSQYVDHLREAHEYLLDAHAVAALRGDASLVHRISGMLQNVGLFLAATSGKTRPGKTITEAESHPSSAQTSYSVELARNLTWRRERRALAQEKNTNSSSSSSDTWPSTLLPSTTGAGGPRRSSLGFTLDLHRIQRDYIDLVPSSWNVLSLSLSLGENDTHDLCITKFQAGQTPFVLRLPLERASSRDADSDVFDFVQGRAELLEIIGGINRTCHEAKGPVSFSSSAPTSQGGEKNGADARAAWWAEREALDTRLGALLENIEQIWLGGFRGIFSQHARRARHLARFQRDFVAVLDQYLPSRRQVGRGKKAASASSSSASGGSGSRGGETKKATLDPNVLELFIGLGDASRPGCDFDEELTDLLYFVVDILQFHGERNAYDEIAFDGMAVATMDALRAYWAGVGDDERHEGSDEDEKEGGDEGGKGGDGKTTHTILLLDKALHVFPWESLPCMRGLAVSRLPSLACLRRLLLDRREAGGLNNSNNNKNGSTKKPREKQRPGHYISPSEGGTYILNPSGDLTSTQATFAQPLASLSSSSQSTTTSSPTDPPPAPWTSILTRPPTEPEFALALTSSPLLLYFGHGSGAQYIRGRTIRRLDPRCRATVLLMGCSSAALSDNGEFEPAGPVWNYLMAGCPAVVGTLWDVTDRDVDRWGGGVLEEWGILPRGTFGKGDDGKRGGKKGDKGKGKETKEEYGRASLVEAVATARGRCRFRFVTAAAAVVYGIPVYVERG